MNGGFRFFSHAFERQVRAHEIALFPEPSIRDSMVDSCESLVCCVKESEIVGIRSDIAMDELDSGCRGVQFSRKGLSWFVEDVSEEDVSSCIMEETNEDSADANGALVKIRLVS